MRPVTKISVFGVRLAVVFLTIYWIALFTGTHLAPMLDISSNIHVSDKSKHFIGYFGLGFLMCYITSSSDWLRRFSAIALVGLSYAAIDEVTQQFVPGRQADLYDYLADAAGLLSAIGIYVAAKYGYKTFRRSPLAT